MSVVKNNMAASDDRQHYENENRPEPLLRELLLNQRKGISLIGTQTLTFQYLRQQESTLPAYKARFRYKR